MSQVPQWRISKMGAAAKLAEAEKALSRATAELSLARQEIKQWEDRAGKWKVGYEQMVGQVLSQNECAASLRAADPAAWEAHFSKQAKRARRLKVVSSNPEAEAA